MKWVLLPLQLLCWFMVDLIHLYLQFIWTFSVSGCFLILHVACSEFGRKLNPNLVCEELDEVSESSR